jgi:ADP-heptose:LPS heptosyltransferase
MRNRAIQLGHLRRFDEAYDCLAEMRMIQPEFPDAHAHEAILRLRLCDYRTGFLEFEWRWLQRSIGPRRRDFQRPLWTGRRSLKDRSILVHTEQGLGDAIQFMRYVPMLAERGAKVVLELPTALLPLVRSLKGLDSVIEYGAVAPRTDFQIPLLSLPLAFGTTLESVPSAVPYLTVDLETTVGWRAKLRQGREKLVGICWRGNPDYPSDKDRSIRFTEFAPLMTAPGVRFISLQKELTEAERHLAGSLPMMQPGLDFKNTAEMISALDWVITVDTAWSHWAGAIGVPVWVLLSYSPHWAWLLDRDDSPWYPGARLFRQPSPGDWKTVLRQVREAFPAGTAKKKARSSS